MMKPSLALFLVLTLLLPVWAQGPAGLREAISADYESHLWPLFDHWHRNPELSLVEHKTAARLAKELRDCGFTVRSTSPENRKLLLDGIKRIAENLGRAAGLPENKLPEVKFSEHCPPTTNDTRLAQRLRKVWTDNMGAGIMMDDAFVAKHRKGMGAEDFPFFTTDPPIRSVYFTVGGTPKADIDAEEAGGAKVPSHHSPLFKIAPEPAIKSGVEATVVALLELMKK